MSFYDDLETRSADAREAGQTAALISLLAGTTDVPDAFRSAAARVTARSTAWRS